MKKGDIAPMVTEKRLPLRLVPRRTRVMIRLAFILTWCGFTFSMFMPQLSSMFRHDLPWERAPSNGVGPFALIFLVVGVVLLARSLMAALPNSPFQYLEIDEKGLTRRRYNKTQHIAWNEVEWISIVERWQSHGRTRSRHWWVLAENAANPFHDEPSRRINSAAFAYDANDFKPLIGGGEETAEQLVELLREGLAKSKGGEPIIMLTLPPLLHGLAVEMRPQSPTGRVLRSDDRKKRRSVIER